MIKMKKREIYSLIYLIKELEGIKNLKNYLKELKIKHDDNYCTIFKYFVNNFETIIKEKKSRIRNKKKNLCKDI